MKRTDFEQFLHCEGVVVLKEVICNTCLSLGGCSGCETTDFEHAYGYFSFCLIKQNEKYPYGY